MQPPGDHAIEEWIQALLNFPRMQGQGHAERAEDANLGLGWLYYALARVIRPENVVVIGSLRGFVPLILGRALGDNAATGHVHFIDPSYVDDFWTSEAAVGEHFGSFGVPNIIHYRMTTQEFVATEKYQALQDIGLLFIDGHHTAEQARFDYEAFAGKLAATSVSLFHDTARVDTSGIYGPERGYLRTVKRFTDSLKSNRQLQVLDLPFDSGVTLVRHAHLDE